VERVPELPELQAHAERLSDDFAGTPLKRLDAISLNALKTFDPSPDAARDEPLRSVGRRGKYLLLDFGETTHVTHLMHGGRIRPDSKQSRRPRGGVARWVFEDGRALLLSEAGTERRAGIWVTTGEAENHEPLVALGPDADRITDEELGAALDLKRSRLHGFLRRQRNLAGVGRRLANEVCFAARLSPFAATTSLDAEQITRLRLALHDVIEESLTWERQQAEMVKVADKPSRVHGRAGEPVEEFDDVVRTVEYRSYTVYYCPAAQTDGKILADNTTSRFLK
jgi:formamidopyrimidine-DNA glycosylase